jgi:hypothetical protein
MSDSFAEFLGRLQARDAAAAQEFFGRFTHQRPTWSGSKGISQERPENRPRKMGHRKRAVISQR